MPTGTRPRWCLATFGSNRSALEKGTRAPSPQMAKLGVGETGLHLSLVLESDSNIGWLPLNICLGERLPVIVVRSWRSWQFGGPNKCSLVCAPG